MTATERKPAATGTIQVCIERQNVQSSAFSQTPSICFQSELWERDRARALLRGHLGVRDGVRRHGGLRVVHLVRERGLLHVLPAHQLRQPPHVSSRVSRVTCNVSGVTCRRDSHAISGMISECSPDTTPTKIPTWTPDMQDQE